MKEVRKDFRVTNHQGFHIKFENGLTLSTQFGWGNYCENKDNPDLERQVEMNTPPFSVQSNNAEVAIWTDNINEDWLTPRMRDEVFGEKDGDIVMGWVPMSDWLKILDWCKSYKKEKKKKKNEKRN